MDYEKFLFSFVSRVGLDSPRSVDVGSFVELRAGTKIVIDFTDGVVLVDSIDFPSSYTFLSDDEVDLIDSRSGLMMDDYCMTLVDNINASRSFDNCSCL
jgi:hypothetical protein